MPSTDWTARSGATAAWSAISALASTSVSTTTADSATTDIVRDTFSSGAAAALLSSRAGETGATWAEVATFSSGGAGKLRISNTSTVYGDGSGNAEYYYASGVPPSADYRVRATFRVNTLGGVNELAAPGILVRQSPTVEQGCMVQFQSTDASAMRWELYEKDVSSSTIMSVYTQTLIAGQDYVVQIRVEGSRVTASIDSVVRMSGTLSYLTLAGRAAIRFYNHSAQTYGTGIHIDDFLADTLPSVVTTVTSTPGSLTSWDARSDATATWTPLA